MDDSYIQNDLTRVEFFFENDNTFPQAFLHKIHFLNESNRRQLSYDYYVAPGSQGDPVSTSRIEILEGGDIIRLKNSIKMVVEIEVIPGQEAFEGELLFRSTGLFSFVF